MDVVYILGKGSLSDDKELKYSIRSLHKNMLDMGAVYVVGEKPKTAPLAKHIPAEDKYPKKWQNMLHKVNLACQDSQITDDFLLMNDDFFMLEPFMGSEFPFYRTKTGDGGPNGTNNFSVHCPIRINKDWFSKMPLDPDMKGDFSPRSFYCNFYRAPSTPTEDHILRIGKGMKTIDEQLDKKPWFSIGNNAMLSTEFLEFLTSEYPAPSTTE